MRSSKCVICRLQPVRALGMCEDCGKAHDRARDRDEGVLALIRWVANRTRRFAVAPPKGGKR